MTLVELCSARHVRTVAIHHICARIDCGVSKRFYVAALFAYKFLRLMRYVGVLGSLCSAMKCHDYDICSIAHLLHHTSQFFKIIYIQIISSVAKLSESDSYALTLYNGHLTALLKSGEADSGTA